MGSQDASFDGFVFVTPEYNHGISGALKNAIDLVYAEWHNKAARFVSYGSASRTRVVEQLRLVMAELQIADVRAQVMLMSVTDVESMITFTPGTHQEHPRQRPRVNTKLNELITWSGALEPLRAD